MTKIIDVLLEILPYVIGIIVAIVFSVCSSEESRIKKYFSFLEKEYNYIGHKEEKSYYKPSYVLKRFTKNDKAIVVEKYNKEKITGIVIYLCNANLHASYAYNLGLNEVQIIYKDEVQDSKNNKEKKASNWLKEKMKNEDINRIENINTKTIKNDYLWNLFINEVCSKEYKQLNRIQKIAVLCFRYDSEMNSGGYSGYKDTYPDTKIGELFEAIKTVGNISIANNYKKALESSASRSDNWEQTDKEYYNFSPSLSDYLEKFIEDNSDMIFDNIRNKTKIIKEEKDKTKEYDLDLRQNDVSGGKISIEQIDSIALFPKAKSIIISGLNQKNFEYFIDKYGNQFEIISFWKNKNIENLSKLEQLTNTKKLVLYFNKKVTELWDLSKNVSLQSLEVYNYEKLHTIDGVQKAKKLEYFAIGDYVSEHTVIDSFFPLINSNVKHFEWYGRDVKDHNYSILAKTNIKVLDINICRFKLDELARLNALFNSDLSGKITIPYRIGTIADMDGTEVKYYILCKGRKMLLVGKDDAKLNKYLKEYNHLLELYKSERKKHL